MGVSIRDNNCHLLHITSYGRANIDGPFKSIEISPRTEVIFCENPMEEGAELTGDWDRVVNRSDSYVLLTFDQAMRRIKLDRIGSILVRTLDGIKCKNDPNCDIGINCVDGVCAKGYCGLYHVPCDYEDDYDYDYEDENGDLAETLPEGFEPYENMDLDNEMERLMTPNPHTMMECQIIAYEQTFWYRVAVAILLIILVFVISQNYFLKKKQ